MNLAIPPTISPFFVHAEPVYLFTGLYLHVGAELVDLLAGGGTIGDGYGFYALPLKGPKPQPESSSVASEMVRSMRRSGLSEP